MLVTIKSILRSHSTFAEQGRTQEKLTSIVAAGGVEPKIVRVAAEGRSIIAALVDHRHRWLWWRPRPFLRGWARKCVDSEQSRDGENLGEVHCGLG